MLITMKLEEAAQIAAEFQGRPPRASFRESTEKLRSLVQEARFRERQGRRYGMENVWSAGQSMGTVTAIEQIVARLKSQYDAACRLPRFDEGVKP